MNCTCSPIHLNDGRREQVGLNWNPDCPEHGIGSDHYKSPEVTARREAMRQRAIDLQLQAREARRRAAES